MKLAFCGGSNLFWLGSAIKQCYNNNNVSKVNRLYAYADDSTLLAIVRKPSDRLPVAASLSRDLARIQSGA